MAKYSAKKLLKLVESQGAEKACENIAKLVEEKKLGLSDFSIQDLAVNFLGEQWNRKFRDLSNGIPLKEGGQSVHSTIFPNITGQLIFSEVRKAFEQPAFEFAKRFSVYKSKIKLTETVPQIGAMTEGPYTVGEGQAYPVVGLSEVYYTLPAAVKQGLGLDLTEEAIFFDLTGDLVKMAAQVGQRLGLDKEKECINLLTGYANNYIRNGTAGNTYLTTGAYVNKLTGVSNLEDWTDIEAAENIRVDILDPETGEPISSISDRQLICMPQKVHTVNHVLRATQIRMGINQNFVETVAPNDIGPYEVVTSDLLYQHTKDTAEATASIAQEGWWLGDIGKTFGWKEIWPLRVFQQGQASESGFNRDVVMRWKARQYGVAYVREPRHMIKVEPTAW